MSQSLDIVFMGTPDFACASLKAIHESGHKVKMVITAPDRPAGRGKKLRSSSVKLMAEDLKLPLLQPTNLKDPKFVAQLRNVKADLFVVVAFRMLPEVVWSMPPKGTINLHGSLLPDYRGAAPINWAILNGDSQTGVSTFFIEKEIDTGDVIQQESLPIGPDENAGDVHDRMMILGASTLVSTIDKIADGTAKGIDQAEFESSPKRPAPKIFKPDCEINWHQSAESVHNHVRGLSPYPTAWSMVSEHSFKVFKGRVGEMNLLNPGAYRIIDGRLFMGTKTHDYEILDLQLAGKKRMSTDVFLRGMSHVFEAKG